MSLRPALLLHALALLAVMLLWPAQARAQSCSTSAQTLAFGSMNTPTAQRDTTADVTVSCTGSAGTTVRVCLAINAGTSPSTVLNRVMVSGGNQLSYQIATSPGGAVWGDYSSAPGTEVSVSIGAGGSGNTTARMYGRVAAGQSAPTGSYTSNLQVTGRLPSGNSPCVNGTGSTLPSSAFQATATLSGNCTIAASTVSFGTVASLASGLTATGGLTINCNPSLPYSVALNAGSTTGNTIAARKMSLGGVGPGVVSYQLYQDAGGTVLWGDGTTGAVYLGTGSGAPQIVPVHARVPSQATPAGGAYSDTVTATITY